MTQPVLNVTIVLLLIITIICMACKSPIVASCFGGLAVLLAGFNLSHPGLSVHIHSADKVGLREAELTPELEMRQDFNMPQDFNKSQHFGDKQYTADGLADEHGQTAHVPSVVHVNEKTVDGNNSAHRMLKCPSTSDNVNVAISPIPNNAYVGQLDQILTLTKQPVVLNYGVAHPRPSQLSSNPYKHTYLPVPNRPAYEDPTIPYVNQNNQRNPAHHRNDSASNPITDRCNGENAASSRDGSIACVVPDLIGDNQAAMKDMIRNQGLYGIRGNLSCEKLRRNAKQDTRFIEPVGARNAWAAYNAYDQQHARDQFMIPAR